MLAPVDREHLGYPGPVGKAVSRVLLAHRDCIDVVPVDLVGGAVYNCGIGARTTCRFKHVEGALGVDSEVLLGIGDRCRHCGLGCSMDDKVHVLHERDHCSEITNVLLDELDRWVVPLEVIMIV